MPSKHDEEPSSTGSGAESTAVDVELDLRNDGWMVLRKRADALQWTEFLAEKLCPKTTNTLSCLRALPADALMEPPSERWLPYIDGVQFPASVRELLRRPEFQRTRLIVGSTRNEAAMFELLELPAISTLAQLRAELMHPRCFDRSPLELW